MTNEPKPDALSLPPHEALARAATGDYLSATALPRDTRHLPATLGDVSLECWGCGQRYVPASRRDHPAFGGARLCPGCRSGQNAPLESWIMEDDAETHDLDELPAPAEKPLAIEAATPKETALQAEVLATTRALAILGIELGRTAPARAHALLVAYTEFQDPAVRAILQRPQEALAWAMGRGPKPQPRETEAEVKDATPKALPSAAP